MTANVKSETKVDKEYKTDQELGPAELFEALFEIRDVLLKVSSAFLLLFYPVLQCFALSLDG
jgi:hypothetical protein